jgi:hydrogenase maturation protein HypF
MMPRIAFRALLQGAVQGQGVRPAVSRLAEERGWCGTVRNSAEGVEILVAAAALDAEDLDSTLRRAVPGIARVVIEAAPDLGWTAFSIEASTADSGLATPVPRDVTICPECLREAESSSNRRYRYGLTSCATCGPRYSLIDAMPFDRARTSLETFSLCDNCRREYTLPSDRRRHAQTIACPACGPLVWVSDRAGRTLAMADDAVVLAARALLDGKIVALRGVGGYQLLVDATDDTAVGELRRRKSRPAKPFAILCRSIEMAREMALLDTVTEKELLSPANPIVLVPRRHQTILADSVSPHLRDIGLLLPTTAVHARLAEVTGRPLVCTSGNRDSEPLVFRVDDALRDLPDIADVFLHHDREIIHPIDDSVVRPMAGRAVTLRAGRGLAPLPLPRPLTGPPALALGAQLKSALAWSNGHQAALGPHVGDLDDITTRERWAGHVAAMESLYGLKDAMFAADAHPDGYQLQWARAMERDVIPVWHHHAHVVAGMVEHGWVDQTVLGIAADGTGFGPDGTIWGGEILEASATAFRRVAHVRPFRLPGGEAAVHDIWRVAVSALGQLDTFSAESFTETFGRPLAFVTQCCTVSRSHSTPVTTSLGRLFDAAAHIALGLDCVTYEGEAAMRLEAACDPTATGVYPWSIITGEALELDWRPALHAMLGDRGHGETPGVMAERFHRGVAAVLVDTANLLARARPELTHVPVVLSGGVFQNRRLVELLVERWPTHLGPLGLPGRIPPNDGGLAAGQLAIAAAHAAKVDNTSPNARAY